MDPQDPLLAKFGLTAFRHPQDLIVAAAQQNKDLFVLLPTGHGKSLTFQYPAFSAKAGCTLVISPLLALIETQVYSLRKKGFSVTAITSQTSKKARRETLAALLHGFPTHRLIYVTPELCLGDQFGEIINTLVTRKQLNRVVIDEAHCAVEWAQFRPEYGKLGMFKEKYPALPVSALTGTASPIMRRQIIETLRLEGPNLESFTLGVNRPNMHLQVKYVSEYTDKLNAVVRRVVSYRDRVAHAIKQNMCLATPYPGSGIIYCRRRQTAEDLAEILTSKGVAAHPYHAQLKAKDKETVITQWIAGDPEYAVIVATVAFGMGIDKPDTRFVIHFELPGNIESFVQQCGRAGRDNRACACTIYFSPAERNTIRGFAVESENENVISSAAALIEYCERVQCRHLTLSEYFDDPTLTPVAECHNGCDVCCDRAAVQREFTSWTQE